MTLSLQTRVLALAGLGVFAAGAALSMLSRQSLLAIDASATREQERAAEFAARAVGRDVLSDLEILQGAVGAPGVAAADADVHARVIALEAAHRRLRLAGAICFTDGSGAPVMCAPDEALVRFTSPAATSASRRAIHDGRPVVSPFAPGVGSPFSMRTGDRKSRSDPGGTQAVAVVPMADGSGAASALVDADGPQVHELLPRADGAMLTSRSDALPLSAPASRRADAPIAGTPWAVTMIEPASSEIDTFRRRSLWLAPSLSALAVLMAWGIVMSVRRPVRALTNAAERIASGDLSRPIAAGDDEIGRLAAALENMRVQLGTSIASVEQANAILERRVRERTAQLVRVLRTVISAQEDERRRVARELHDETSQLVAAMAMALDGANRTLSPTRIADLRMLLDRMHDGLHRVIVNLRPSVLDDLGLAAAIEWLAEHQLRRAGILARCELGDLQDCRVDSAIEIALFRIVQESISNIVRHADASAVLIQGGLSSPLLEVPGTRLWIEIEDDGIGFEPEGMSASTETLRGVGLLGMRERIELIGGRLQIESAPGEGTRIRIDAPVHIVEEALV